MSQANVEFMRSSAPDPEAHARGIADLRAKLAIAMRARDDNAIVDHAADLGSMLTTARQESEALSLLNAHRTVAEALPEAEPSGWFWNAYATALQYSGSRTEADLYFAKAHDLCVRSDWVRLKALVLHHWGRSLAEQRRFAEAETKLSEALALRARLGDPKQESSRRALEVLAELRRTAAEV